MTYDVATLVIRLVSAGLVGAYVIRVIARHQSHRALLATVLSIGSGALVVGGLAPFGVIDPGVGRVIYTAVSVVLFIVALSLLTVDEQ